MDVQKEVFHIILGVLGPNHMIPTMEQPACRPKPNAASLPLESLVNKGKYTDQCPVGGHDCYSSLTMKNSDLQLSQIAPQHIISSSQRPYTW